MMKPFTPLAFLAPLLLLLASAASALTLRVTDRDLQGLIAQGVSEGNRLTLQIAASASGPVMVFIIDGSNVSSYPAELRGGQIVLDGPSGTTLAKLLAGRGITLSTQPVAPAPSRSFSLPGLASPASGTAQPDEPDGAESASSGEGKAAGKGKANGKDKGNGNTKDKNKGKGKS